MVDDILGGYPQSLGFTPPPAPVATPAPVAEPVPAPLSDTLVQASRVIGTAASGSLSGVASIPASKKDFFGVANQQGDAPLLSKNVTPTPAPVNAPVMAAPRTTIDMNRIRNGVADAWATARQALGAVVPAAVEAASRIPTAITDSANRRVAAANQVLGNATQAVETIRTGLDTLGQILPEPDVELGVRVPERVAAPPRSSEPRVLSGTTIDMNGTGNAVLDIPAPVPTPAPALAPTQTLPRAGGTPEPYTAMPRADQPVNPPTPASVPVPAVVAPVPANIPPLPYADAAPGGALPQMPDANAAVPVPTPAPAAPRIGDVATSEAPQNNGPTLGSRDNPEPVPAPNPMVDAIRALTQNGRVLSVRHDGMQRQIVGITDDGKLRITAGANGVAQYTTIDIPQNGQFLGQNHNGAYVFMSAQELHPMSLTIQQMANSPAPVQASTTQPLINCAPVQPIGGFGVSRGGR